MSTYHIGLKAINGSLVVIDGVKNASYDELVTIKIADGSVRQGRIVQIDGEKVVIQVFEGTSGLSLENTKTEFTGRPIEMPLSTELLGRIINGSAINPVSRLYPRNFIETGISSIDALTTLIRGQKLPIFSNSGLPHNEIAVQIVNQARISNDTNEKFCIVFAAMGIKNDVAEYFKTKFEESGVLQRVVMFLNLSNDPIIERILTPRMALTAAEFLAFEKNMHVLVILTDITAYAEAVREFSSSKGEIPGRKGYPGYLYSDLAQIYERAGVVKGSSGSVTQIPILTMPNGDITNPVPDLTGYITEGQIVLSSELFKQGIFPPVAILPSLSRLMKDGIGEKFTRFDHADVANQLFASYAKVADAKSLASVIGEEELSPVDKLYLKFGSEFENRFLNQGFNKRRTIEQTLNLGWELLRLLPKQELNRINTSLLDEMYIEKNEQKL